MHTDRIYTYEQEKIYRAASDAKHWALTAKPGESLEGSRITRETLVQLAYVSFIGVGHVPEIALARMDTMVRHPRESSEGYYYDDRHSFIMPVHNQDPLTVLVFKPASRGVGRDWLIESFVDGAVEPDTTRLPMNYPIMEQSLNASPLDEGLLVQHLERMYPTAR